MLAPAIAWHAALVKIVTRTASTLGHAHSSSKTRPTGCPPAQFTSHQIRAIEAPHFAGLGILSGVNCWLSASPEVYQGPTPLSIWKGSQFSSESTMASLSAEVERARGGRILNKLSICERKRMPIFIDGAFASRRSDTD